MGTEFCREMREGFRKNVKSSSAAFTFLVLPGSCHLLILGV